MFDSLHIRLSDPTATITAGRSVARSLYTPCTIWLDGELGAGKTTFLQAFAKELGVREHVVSPTFALEQRYATHDWGELLHADLYRLTPNEASAFVRSSEDHTGIRCIEWANRLADSSVKSNGIHIHLEDRGNHGRMLHIDFHDIHIPSDNEIDEWRKEVDPPSMVLRHCEVVANVAVQLAATIIDRRMIVRTGALRAAAKLHDLLRYLDFSHGAGHVEEEINKERSERWAAICKKYQGLRHEAACAEFLRQHDFPAIASIVQTHGLSLDASARTTIEQRLLYYADKRVKMDEIVSLEERLADFSARYGKGKESWQSTAWYDEARATEKMLFPDGPPL